MEVKPGYVANDKIKQLENLQMRNLKRLFKLPQGTPNAAIRGDTGCLKACLHDAILRARYLAVYCVQHLARYPTRCSVSQ